MDEWGVVVIDGRETVQSEPGLASGGGEALTDRRRPS
jgi:hypothetical protein